MKSTGPALIFALLCATNSAWAGVASFSGYPDKGVPVFGVAGPGMPEANADQPTVTGFNTLMNTSGPGGNPKIRFEAGYDYDEGYWKVSCNLGLVKGGFSRTSPPGALVADYVTISDGTDYTYEAHWLVPANPMSAAWYSTSENLPARMFVGTDLGGGPGGLGASPGGYGVAGITWNPSANQWMLSSNEPPFNGNDTLIGADFTQFAIRGIKRHVMRDGNLTAYFRGEYSIDGGTTWNSMPIAPLYLANQGTIMEDHYWVECDKSVVTDTGDDYLAWSICGNAASNMSFTVTGPGVPEINPPIIICLCPRSDHDHDGLRDLDEFTIWGVNWLDPDTDGDGLLDGLEASLYPQLDPRVYNTATLPVVGGTGLVLLTLTLATLGARRSRLRENCRYIERKAETRTSRSPDKDVNLM